MSTQADGEVWARLIRLYEGVEHELGQAMQRRHGIGLSDYLALCELSKAPDGELRMQDLAAAVGLNQSSVTRLVARLEKTRLTVRDMCPSDRRGVYTVITEDGRAAQAKAQPTYDTVVTEQLDAAAADPALAPLVQGLRRAHTAPAR